MCGIAGAVNWGDSNTLARMTDVQAHRGPDDRGIWESRLPDGTWVGLGSRRLAILDLSPAGHMPMSNEDGTLWLTYNGEIYNFPQLRRELTAKGHAFRSRTDTEVILHLYEEEGPGCVERLDGMFALALCDLRTSTLFVARDHFGVKPLYYRHAGRRFAFASEVKALLELPGDRPGLDREALQQYLTFLWVPDPATLFEGVMKLPAGHYALFRDGHLDVVQYWDLAYPPADADYRYTEAEQIEEVRHRFRNAVRAQLISDVPVGAFLSAGLDSSAIVAEMAAASNAPVRTYTITFPREYLVGERTLDDPRVPAEVARAFGCDHHQIVVRPDVATLLPDLLWHMDEPVADPAIIAAYLVCREARGAVTVMLSGIGGDELFAGYRKHYAHYWGGFYRHMPHVLRQALIEPAVGALPGLRGTPFKGLVRLTKKMVQSGGLPPRDAFLMNSTYLTAEERRQLCRSSVWTNGAAEPWFRHLLHFDRVGHADFLHQMLYVDTKAFMVSLNLTYNDKMSMASSVEVRVPFLDRALAEFVARHVPPHMKLRGRARPTTKYVFREAMRGLLPDVVFRQPKAGFAAPIDYWLACDLREMSGDLLSEDRVRRRGYFDPAVVRRLVEEHRAGRQDRSWQIWLLMTLELWAERFLPV